MSRHQHAVFRICYNILKNKAIAEEVAQDVFIKAFENLKKLNEPTKFRAWVLRIAYRKAIDEVRKKEHRFTYSEESKLVADKTAGIEERLTSDYQSETIAKAIHELGDPDASIFTLFYLEELTTEEVAEALDLSKSNVKIRLMRGREKLKIRLQKILNQF